MSINSGTGSYKYHKAQGMVCMLMAFGNTICSVRAIFKIDTLTKLYHNVARWAHRHKEQRIDSHKMLPEVKRRSIVDS
jgi:hypothetical protein